MTDVIEAVAAAAAVLVLLVVLQDSFEVMLLPRRIDRRVRLTGLFFRATWAVWAAAALRFSTGQRRERMLGVYGPLSMIVLFALWAGGLIVSFGLLEWDFGGRASGSPLSEQLYMSGVTFFTLGFGDVVPRTGLARLTAVIEAGTGIGFIAIVIGYLPVLYQLFSRREAHVIQLDGRAGSPPSAGTMLRRHAEADGLTKLDDLLREWEVWGAELLESHLSYPMLAYYRSQHGNQSWLAALATIMDTCALILVGVTKMQPLQARMTFTMARQVLLQMAHSFDVAPSRYDGGDRLDHDEYHRLEQALAKLELGWRGGQETEEILQVLRSTYEPLLDGMAQTLLLTLPAWTERADVATDHWQQGPRGLIAARLIEELADRGADVCSPAGQDQQLLWRRIRARLRSQDPIA